LRAGVYYNNRDVRVEERPRPRIGPGELLVRIEASGICGSDLMEWYRAARAPLVLGHEVAGEIAEVGEGVEGYHAGDRVSVTHHVPCLECRYCNSGHETTCETLHRTTFDPGGFAEYVRMPAINVRHGVLKLPDNVSFEEGAFVEPVGCVVRGLRLARFRPGDTVAVIGAGPSGLLYAHVAAMLGAGPVICVDLVENRLAAARALGAAATLHPADDPPARLPSLNEGRRADLVVLCAASPAAIGQGLKCVERGGTVLFSAPSPDNQPLPIPINDLFWRNEITLTSSYASGPADSVEALALIASGRLRVRETVSHRLGLGEIGHAFELAASAASSLKVMVEPQR
jgi:L-iditol 2-dehydrogenase